VTSTTLGRSSPRRLASPRPTFSCATLASPVSPPLPPQPSSATAALLCHRSPPLPRLDRTAAPGSHALAVRRCAAEYGDKDNSDIAERFSIKTDDFPQYRLWKKGSDASKDPVKFSGDKKNEEFMKFIQTNAGVWVGLPGQVKELDALAKEFTR
jgi:hypothetical protein